MRRVEEMPAMVLFPELRGCPPELSSSVIFICFILFFANAVLCLVHGRRMVNSRVLFQLTEVIPKVFGAVPAGGYGGCL